MDLSFAQVYCLVIVVFLVVALYREIFNPSLTFFIATVALLLGGIITPEQTLNGLSNKQIIIVFLLVLVTAGIRLIFGSEIFAKLFNPRLKPKQFLLRLMLTVSSISAFLNNTPIVAFMIPYVKDWAKKTGNPASKFLIPLSFATILGGMITVIGTSTNLVLNGLIGSYNLPVLGFEEFFYLGVIVTIVGWVYLYFIGYNLLPANENKIDELRENLKEYIVETEIARDSKLVGKTVKEAGLRNLQDVFLVEIIRGQKAISPVAPEEVLEPDDALFFSGNTQSIYHLIREDNGLSLPKAEVHDIEDQFHFVDAVIPANSELIGKRIKDSNFRQRFNASIIAIHRDGKRVAGKVGETHLAGGDFLLLLSGDQKTNGISNDLFFLSVPKRIKQEDHGWKKYLGIGCMLLLIAGVIELIPLFTACLVILCSLVFFGILTLSEIRKELDLSLLLILVCSLAIGIGLEKSGTADLIAQLIIGSVKSLGPVAVLSALFMVTVFLTCLITNAAAVSIVFPIAMSIAEQMQLSHTPFFVAIAFAASGDFMTPIGYQTNLMIYGPGGYMFKDFMRVGTPLTIVYVLICVTFISFFYGLV
ncbi:MAG TPA: SLC13 family permease [Chryseosolibacter sp.]|nr:SLC13 family permease [Chryseosolibacter sp.]